MSDPVSPSYYSQIHETLGCDVIDIIHALFADNFDLGQVLRYIARAGKKPGNPYIQDLKKARRYLDWAIDLAQSDEEGDVLDDDSQEMIVSIDTEELAKNLAGYLTTEVDVDEGTYIGFKVPQRKREEHD